MVEAKAETGAVVFAGGGTGGHLYPALAVAARLRRDFPSWRIVFLATDRAIDHQILSETEYDVIAQALPAVSGRPWRWPGMFMAYRRALASCVAKFREDRPAVVVGTGGLGSWPGIRAAARLGIPSALLNPDAVPGRANRYLIPHVTQVYAQWHTPDLHLRRGPAPTVVGCPIRGAFDTLDRASALRMFDLEPGRRTLLITGASQGCRNINEALVANLDLLDSESGWQILHLTGRSEHASVVQAYAGHAVTAKVLAYTEKMAEALTCADLVISRAGASTLAEITAVGRASIVFPYPYHRDMHQLANAKCLNRGSTVAATCILKDSCSVGENAPRLRKALQSLMFRDDLRASMARAAAMVGRRDAARKVAAEVVVLAKNSQGPAACEFLESAMVETR
ncbi:MAG: UDP-N-acetylglucosamine--N-acetylmuramyl-(pentapeptide) pyrophosphoryl-undecaprenol N-acetylglucosamine transferase [Planctomycetota bacterium]